jgi:hypothetical protein
VYWEVGAQLIIVTAISIAAVNRESGLYIVSLLFEFLHRLTKAKGVPPLQEEKREGLFMVFLVGMHTYRSIRKFLAEFLWAVSTIFVNTLSFWHKALHHFVIGVDFLMSPFLRIAVSPVHLLLHCHMHCHGG